MKCVGVWYIKSQPRSGPPSGVSFAAPFSHRLPHLIMSAAASLSTQLIPFSLIPFHRQIAHHNNVNRPSADLSYDSVVVGSGSSGAVVANRLAANPNIRVLLLEGGGPQTVITDAPGLAPSLVGTEVDWQYVTEPQTNMGLGFNGGRVRQAKGL